MRQLTLINHSLYLIDCLSYGVVLFEKLNCKNVANIGTAVTHLLHSTPFSSKYHATNTILVVNTIGMTVAPMAYKTLRRISRQFLCRNWWRLNAVNKRRYGRNLSSARISLKLAMALVLLGVPKNRLLVSRKIGFFWRPENAYLAP